MLRRISLCLLSIASFLVLTPLAIGETKVTVSQTHLCCPQCVTGVESALKDVKGVSHKCDQKAKTIAIVAESDGAAQQAIDALEAAGFYGKLNSEKVKYKSVEAPKGKVERIELTGIHNCCGACTQAIKKAIGTVDGVKADTVKPKQDSFVVEGEFDAAKLIDALLSAGFHVTVKK